MARKRDRGYKPVALIPVFDNVRTVTHVVEGASRHLPVIVVDDGSMDGSGEAAAQAGAEVIRHQKNMGKGAALITGMRYAANIGYSHAVTLDADGQHDPEDIPSLLSAMKSAPEAIVVGKRLMKEGGAPLASRLGLWISDFWVLVEGFKFIADAQCGYRVYPIHRVLDLGLKTKGFDMEIEVLVRAARAGMDFVSVPVKVQYRHDRTTHFDMVSDNVRLSALNAKLTMEIPFFAALRMFDVARKRFNHADCRVSVVESFGFDVAALMTFLIGKDAAKALVLSFAVPFYFLKEKQVRTNLTHYAYLVRPTTSKPTRTLLAYRIMHNFADSMIDRYLTRSSSPLPWNREKSLPGIVKIKRELSRGKGALLVTAHMGRWAQAAQVLEREGLAPLVVMDTRELDSFVSAARKRSLPFPEVIPAEQGPASALAVLDALKRGRLVTMMGDRPASSGNVEVTFLKRRVELPLGPYLMAAHTGVPWFAVGPFMDEHGEIVTIVEGPFRPPRRFAGGRKERREWAEAEAARFASILDGWCRSYPDQWFNFRFSFDPVEQGAVNEG